jgi:flagellar basal body-associated protein FliL
MKLSLKGMIMAGAVVAAMTLEAVVFLLLMPSHPPSAAGDAQVSDKTAATDEQGAIDTAEEPLGDPFNCTNSKEESNLHLRFKVAAVVKANQTVPFRESKEAHKNRVRQAVEKIVRSANREDLNDPNLSTLKRLIREEVNKILGKSFVIEAVIHDFSMIEQ